MKLSEASLELTHLDHFLDWARRQKFAWGEHDCSLIIADWVVANGHADPAIHWRGTYRTQKACQRLTDEAGGLVAVFADCAARAGLTPLSEPENGCVAVIGAAERSDRQWGAIRRGKWWLVRSPTDATGFTGFTAKPLCMWRV